MSKRLLQLFILVTIFAVLVSACGGDEEEPTEAPPEPTAAPAEATAAPAEPTKAPEAEATEPPPMGEECPPSTLADPMGLSGEHLGQFELAEYEEKAGCKMTFSENPDIADFNARITNNPELPPVEERLSSTRPER